MVQIAAVARARGRRPAAGPVLAHGQGIGPLHLFGPRRARIDELAEDDNQLASAVVKVLSRERVRVLLVAGAPTWEYRLVQKLLSRDKTITVSCWLQTLDEERAQEGTRPITRLPITKEELFYYDVMMLFDPNPQEFDHGLDGAAQAVRRRAFRRPPVYGRPQALRPIADQRPHIGTGARCCR